MIQRPADTARLSSPIAVLEFPEPRRRGPRGLVGEPAVGECLPDDVGLQHGDRVRGRECRSVKPYDLVPGAVTRSIAHERLLRGLGCSRNPSRRFQEKPRCRAERSADQRGIFRSTWTATTCPGEHERSACPTKHGVASPAARRTSPATSTRGSPGLCRYRPVGNHGEPGVSGHGKRPPEDGLESVVPSTAETVYSTVRLYVTSKANGPKKASSASTVK